MTSQPKHIAIQYGNQTIQYPEFLSRIGIFSGLYNIEPGDRVVVISENRPGWFYAFYSVWMQAGIPVPIDFMATVSEVGFIVKDCSPKVIFCSADLIGKVEEAQALAGTNARILSVNQFELAPVEEQSNVGFDSVKVTDSEDTAVIIYTSGTTGSPKGVMLSFLNLLTNVNAVSLRIPIYKSDSRVMVLLPLHHVFPLVGTMIIPFHLGAMVAVSPSMVSADILQTLQNNKITIIIGVPRLYAAIRKGIVDKIQASVLARNLFALAAKLQSKKFSKIVFGAVHRKLGGAVEVLVAGGAALDPVVGRDFKTLGFEVLEGYGMTEAAPMITFTRPGRVRIGSPGEVMPETKVSIEENEILAAGPNIMKGYFNRPDETAAVLKNGWLHTGDLGRLDDQGFLFITGRKKEIIVLSNGKNVNPAELEEVLLASPMVKDCGVYYDKDTLRVILQTNPTQFEMKSEAEKEEMIRRQLIEPFNKSVSSYKKLMHFFLTDNDLPRTRLGKLQRFKLAELAVKDESVPEQSDESLFTPEFKIVASYIQNEKSVKLLPHHHIEIDLGLDSLDKVGFQVFLQQTFGLMLEPSRMTDFRTMAELTFWISEHKTKTEESSVNWKEILLEKVHLSLPRTWFTGNLAIWFSRAFFHLYFRFRGRGLQNLPEGPFILAANHQSYFDGLLVASFLRTKHIRRTYIYAKEKHIRKPWLKFLANRNNIIIMDLNKELKESIQKMGEVLKQNKNLIIFPEGTRSGDGKLGQFKKTFAILSSELNVPIVPVSIKGAFEALPRGSWFPKPWKKIHIEFLKPVYPEKLSYENLSELVKSKIQLNMDTKAV